MYFLFVSALLFSLQLCHAVCSSVPRSRPAVPAADVCNARRDANALSSACRCLRSPACCYCSYLTLFAAVFPAAAPLCQLPTFSHECQHARPLLTACACLRLPVLLLSLQLPHPLRGSVPCSRAAVPAAGPGQGQAGLPEAHCSAAAARAPAVGRHWGVEQRAYCPSKWLLISSVWVF
jgi:hypothetical protein